MLFWLYCIGIAIAFGLQNTLIAPFARRHDSWELTAVRNLSFVFTFLPIALFFSGADSLWQVVSRESVSLALGATFGCFAMWFRNVAFKRSSAAVLVAVIMTVQTTTLLVYDVVWYHRAITTMQAVAACTILVSAAACSAWSTPTESSVKLQRKNLGWIAGIGCGLFTALSVIPLAEVCQSGFDAIAAGVVWEIYIGVVTALIAAMIRVRSPHKVKITLREGLGIAAAGFPAVIATVLMALASRLNAMSIVTAIESSSIVVTAVSAHYLLDERLTLSQWYAVLLVLGGIGAIRLTLA